MARRPIPHQDPWRANAAVETRFLRELRSLYRDSAFCGSAHVERFEDAFAASLGSPQAAAVSSGTAALHLALLALGIGAGDDVVVPAYTFAGSTWGVLYCGARPVFADVDPGTGNLDPAAVARAWTRRTRAVIAVHLFGRPAPLPDLLALARARGAFLIEDAAQAHGGRLQGRSLGTWGDAGCFSFYPTKNLGGCGEGGAVVSPRRSVVERIRLLRNHASPRRGLHVATGFNARMGGIEALFLRLKLPLLESWNAERRAIAERYLRGLEGTPISPLCRSADDSVWHAFVCRAPRRKALLAHLDARGIGHAVHYPRILPSQPAFKGSSYARGDFTGARLLARTAFSLPVYPGLKPSEIARVAGALREWRGS